MSSRALGSVLRVAIAAVLAAGLQCGSPVVGTLPPSDSGAGSEGGGNVDAPLTDVASGEDVNLPEANADTGGSSGDASADAPTADSGPLVDSAVPDSASGDAQDSSVGDAGSSDGSSSDGSIPVSCPPGKHLCKCDSGNNYCLKIGFTCIVPSSC